MSRWLPATATPGRRGIFDGAAGGIPDGVPAAPESLGGFAVLVTVLRRMSVEPILVLTVDDVPESDVRLTRAAKSGAVGC